MTITPFLAQKLRTRRDALVARQRARRVAQLLQFETHDQACIAAGAFVIACQALEHLDRARLCFQIENRQLHIFAEEGRTLPETPESPVSERLAGLLPPVDPRTLYRLAKQLPFPENPAEEPDVAWALQKVESLGGAGLFDEIVKQNQEILALLHELRMYREEGLEKFEKPSAPHAA